MPYLTPDTAPSDTICRTLVIPNDPYWISIVNGALSVLMFPYNFQAFGTSSPEDTAYRFGEMWDEYHDSECNPPMTYPTRAEFDHATSTVLNGNAISWNANANQLRGGASRQSAAAINDEFTNQVFLAAGTYTLYFVGIRSSGSGLLDLYIGSTYIGQFEMYAASTTTNFVHSASVTVPSDGVHKIRGKVAGKNASSGGYACNVTVFYFKQTTD